MYIAVSSPNGAVVSTLLHMYITEMAIFPTLYVCSTCMIMSLYEVSPTKNELRGVQALVWKAACERVNDVDTTAPFGLLTAMYMVDDVYTYMS